MDIAKYRALFIEESREHLAHISRILVEVEHSDNPTSLVDEVFRHIHSVKGMAASMGYDPINTLAHRMEDIVAQCRQSNERIAKETIDYLLRGVDALSEQVDSIAGDRTLNEHIDIVQQLGRLMNVLAADTAPPAAADPQQESYLIDVFIHENSVSPSVRAFMVHQRIAQLATVQKSAPTLATIKRGDVSVRRLQLIVQPKSTLADIRRTIRSVADIKRVAIREATGDEELTAEIDEKFEEGAVVFGDGDVQPEAAGGATVRVRTEVLDTLIDGVGELFLIRESLRASIGSRMTPTIQESMDKLSHQIQHLHDHVMAVRMMPLKTLTERYPRLVRDLARSLGKEVEVEIEGSDIELDRGMLDGLDAPFIHILRNAVDHGIELPNERVALGKPSTGRIQITAVDQHGRVEISISDDGIGLSPDKIRSEALARGLISKEQAAYLSERELAFLICEPGFSTKKNVSNLSGRGVGMDAVRTMMNNIGATLEIESKSGFGSRFIITLPTTLAVVPVLLVEVSGQIFAIASPRVLEVQEKHSNGDGPSPGSGEAHFRDTTLPIVELSHLLKIVSDAPSQFVVIVDDASCVRAISVERVIGYRDIVVRPLGEPLERLQYLNGAGVLGNGQPLLILDLPQLFEMSGNPGAH